MIEINIVADLHTHTIASGHAYSTLEELARVANEKGLKLIAITDHGPKMPGAPHEYYFSNLRVIPEIICGVRILKGVEANIRNDGKLDLADRYLKELDFVVAGIHGGDTGYDNQTKVEHTKAMINAMKNPYVKMISHPDNPKYPINLEAVVQAAREYRVILELNAGSFDRFRLGKRGDKKKAIKFCRLAKKYQVPLSLNSDAHFSADVGNIETLSEIIKEAELTEADVINSSFERIEKFIKK